MWCVDCHGQFLRSSDGLPRARWLDLLGDLEELGVPSVSYSGAYTDPATDEELLSSLLKRGARRWGVKLHTCGLALTERVRGAVLYAAGQGIGDNFVNLSKVAVDQRTFERMCRPSGSLQTENERLTALFRAGEGCEGFFTIRLNCRLTRINGTVRHLTELLRWLASTSDRVPIRFTTDYQPTSAPPEYCSWFRQKVYLPPAEAQDAIARAVEATGFRATRVSFRAAEGAHYAGDRCYNGLLLAAVSANGMVFPCQGIASSKFAAVAYGDLRQESFLDAWRRYVFAWPTSSRRHDCPRCVGACEGHINAALKREVESC